MNRFGWIALAAMAAGMIAGGGGCVVPLVKTADHERAVSLHRVSRRPELMKAPDAGDLTPVKEGVVVPLWVRHKPMAMEWSQVDVLEPRLVAGERKLSWPRVWWLAKDTWAPGLGWGSSTNQDPGAGFIAFAEGCWPEVYGDLWFTAALPQALYQRPVAPSAYWLVPRTIGPELEDTLVAETLVQPVFKGLIERIVQAVETAHELTDGHRRMVLESLLAAVEASRLGNSPQPALASAFPGYKQQLTAHLKASLARLRPVDSASRP